MLLLKASRQNSQLLLKLSLKNQLIQLSQRRLLNLKRRQSQRNQLSQRKQKSPRSQRRFPTMISTHGTRLSFTKRMDIPSEATSPSLSSSMLDGVATAKSSHQRG